MAAGYFDEKQIELCNAVGEFIPFLQDLEDCLPFPKEQMNFMLLYEEGGEDHRFVEEMLNGIYRRNAFYRRLDPTFEPRIPQAVSMGRVFSARESGQRSAVIDASHFDREINIEGAKAAGIKIKGCRLKGGPPAPIPFMPEVQYYPKDPVMPVMPAPEDFPAYEKDGTEYIGFKDQPCGITVKDASMDVRMSMIAYKLGVPSNMFGLGTGRYSDVIYPGNHYYKRKEDLLPEQMGTGVFALFDTDERVSDLIVGLEPSHNPYVDDVSVEHASVIVGNFQRLSNELDMGFDDILNGILFRGTGEFLRHMHLAGMIHGPRQSHFSNYIVPTKDYKGLRVCDFESSLLVAQLTNIQALNYMRDDFFNLMDRGPCNLFATLQKSLIKAIQFNAVPKGCDVKGIGSAIGKHNVMDIVIRGYTDDEMGLEDVAEYGKKELATKVVERTMVGQLDGIREDYIRLLDQLKADAEKEIEKLK